MSLRVDGVAGSSSLSKLKQEASLRRGKQAKGDYINTLVNPLDRLAGCRIPDMTAYPSSIYTDSLEATISLADPAAAGRHGFAVVITPGGMSLYQESSASTLASIAYESAVVQEGVGKSRVVAGYQSTRVVAAGVRVEFIGSDANNGGLLNAAYVTSSDFRRGTSFGSGSMLFPYTSLTNISNARLGYNGALKNGFKGHYLPLDPADFTYRKPYDDSSAFTNTFDTDYFPICAFQFVMSAYTANVNVRITVVAHYEGLLLDEASIVGNMEDVVMDIGEVQQGMALANANGNMHPQVQEVDLRAMPPLPVKIKPKAPVNRKGVYKGGLTGKQMIASERRSRAAVQTLTRALKKNVARQKARRDYAQL